MWTESTRTPLVSIVVPLYNEAGTIEELMRRLAAVTASLRDRYAFEFVWVDDGSRDDTMKIAERLAAAEPRLRVVSLRRNYGQTAALQVGFEHVTGAVVISMDGDLQHFPEDVPKFLEQIEHGYDVVCGWRHQRREGIERRWPSKVANWIIRGLTGVQVHDIGTTFRAYQGDLVHQLRLLGEHHRFIPAIAKSLGARITEVPIENVERTIGTSNYGLSRTLNVVLDILFLVFYVRYLDRPMRVFGRLALAALAGGGIISAALAYITFVYGVPVVRERTGWFMLALVLLVSGIQFLLFGLLSEVVVRLYFYPGQTKPYLVRRVLGGTERSRT